MKPKVTVLMPVYNGEKYLKESIESILNQTFKDFEFLIINDASIDNSKKIILSYKDPRIIYIENKINLGVARSLNKGLKLAKGAHIARMDADDISMPERLKLQYKTISQNSSLAVVATCNEIMDKDGNYSGVWNSQITPEEIYYDLHFKDCLAHPTVMFNKNIILGHFDGYDEDREAEDYDLWLKVSKNYKIIKLERPLLKLRINYKSSRIGTWKKKINDDSLKITRNYILTLTGELPSLSVMNVLADRYSFDTPPKDIKNALLFLKKINKAILKNTPSFLEKSGVGKTAFKKELSLKLTLIVSIVNHSKFSSEFKFLYDFYRRLKLKIGELNNKMFCSKEKN